MRWIKQVSNTQVIADNFSTAQMLDQFCTWTALREGFLTKVWPGHILRCFLCNQKTFIISWNIQYWNSSIQEKENIYKRFYRIISFNIIVKHVQGIHQHKELSWKPCFNIFSFKSPHRFSQSVDSGHNFSKIIRLLFFDNYWKRRFPLKWPICTQSTSIPECLWEAWTENHGLSPATSFMLAGFFWRFQKRFRCHPMIEFGDNFDLHEMGVSHLIISIVLQHSPLFRSRSDFGYIISFLFFCPSHFHFTPFILGAAASLSSLSKRSRGFCSPPSSFAFSCLCSFLLFS